jgi:hypothetical protein
MKPRRFNCACSAPSAKWQNKTGGEGESGTHVCENAVCEIVLLSFHAPLDDSIPNFDILGVQWGLLERGDSEVHISPLAKQDDPPKKFE